MISERLICRNSCTDRTDFVVKAGHGNSPEDDLDMGSALVSSCGVWTVNNLGRIVRTDDFLAVIGKR
jgi:hypothetical protein